MAEILALAKLAGLDELEYVRGAVAGFSCGPNLAARELHIGRLARLLDHAGLSHSLDVTLDTLEQLREVQRLDGGYVLPTPIRCVELTNRYRMLIAVHPTDELIRHFPSVSRVGAARFIAERDSTSLMSQPLMAWMGADGRSAATWTQLQIMWAKTKLMPSVYDDTIQSFGLTSKQGSSCGALPTWVPLSSENHLSWQGVMLCRTPIATKRYRYFFGRTGVNQTFHEGPAVYDHLRARFGLAALVNRPLSIQFTERSTRTVIRLPLPLPHAERRLLIALCRQEAQASSYAWSCPSVDIWPIVKDGLRNLECEFVEHG